MNYFSKYKSYIIILLMIFLGFLTRVANFLGPNVEIVTAFTLISAVYFGKKWSIIVPFTIMAVSDLFLGNTRIFIFTWSAYIIMGVAMFVVRRKASSLFDSQDKSFFFISPIFAISASVWFFLWTNFGVWLLDSWGMYARSFNGLIKAYIFGLPFLKYNLIGNLVFIPTSFFLIRTIKKYFLIEKFSINKI